MDFCPGRDYEFVRAVYFSLPSLAALVRTGGSRPALEIIKKLLVPLALPIFYGSPDWTLSELGFGGSVMLDLVSCWRY